MHMLPAVVMMSKTMGLKKFVVSCSSAWTRLKLQQEQPSLVSCFAKQCIRAIVKHYTSLTSVTWATSMP